MLPAARADCQNGDGSAIGLEPRSAARLRGPDELEQGRLVEVGDERVDDLVVAPDRDVVAARGEEVDHLRAEVHLAPGAPETASGVVHDEEARLPARQLVADVGSGQLAQMREARAE